MYKETGIHTVPVVKTYHPFPVNYYLLNKVQKTISRKKKKKKVSPELDIAQRCIFVEITKLAGWKLNE